MLSKTVPALHILRNAIVVKIILLQLGWFMFEKIKTTLEKDYYLNSNPFFSEEKRKLSIIYIYPNQVFVEKTSHAELKNDVFNLAELNRIVHCLLNIYIYRLSSPCCSFTDLLKTCQIIQQLLKTCNNWPKDDKVHCTRNKDYVQLFSKKINV